jgi:hypothetical protein
MSQNHERGVYILEDQHSPELHMEPGFYGLVRFNEQIFHQAVDNTAQSCSYGTHCTSSASAGSSREIEIFWLNAAN